MSTNKTISIWLTAIAAAAHVAVGADVSETAAVRDRVAAAIGGSKLAEVPNRAARLVLSAPAIHREAVARLAVEQVLAKFPTATTATVRAVVAAAPEVAQPVLMVVQEKGPSQFRNALRVVGEMQVGFAFAPQNSAGASTTKSFSPEGSIGQSVAGQGASFAPPRLPFVNLQYIATQQSGQSLDLGAGGGGGGGGGGGFSGGGLGGLAGIGALGGLAGGNFNGLKIAGSTGAGTAIAP